MRIGGFGNRQGAEALVKTRTLSSVPNSAAPLSQKGFFPAIDTMPSKLLVPSYGLVPQQLLPENFTENFCLDTTMGVR